MKIQTRGFGEIEYSADEVVTFPDGLVGLGEFRQFVILALENYHPFKFMQSLDQPGTFFILVNPQMILPSFTIALQPDDKESIALSEDGMILQYAIVTIPSDEGCATANLFSPVVINPGNMLARQVVMLHSPYSIAEPVGTITPDPAVDA